MCKHVFTDLQAYFHRLAPVINGPICFPSKTFQSHLHLTIFTSNDDCLLTLTRKQVNACYAHKQFQQISIPS